MRLADVLCESVADVYVYDREFVCQTNAVSGSIATPPANNINVHPLVLYYFTCMVAGMPVFCVSVVG